MYLDVEPEITQGPSIRIGLAMVVGTNALSEALSLALSNNSTSELDRIRDTDPIDNFDAALALLQVCDVYLGNIDLIGPSTRLQHHPSFAAISWRLAERFLSRLDELDQTDGPMVEGAQCDAVTVMRSIAHIDLVPEIYDWFAERADINEALEFLILEGGPDAGFDDLVATCQIGLTGGPKLELAKNYWDEMGNGRLGRVHTELHRKLIAALGLKHPPRTALPLQALEKAALGSLLAANRWLQPEMVGALGMIEMQAGPRCRRIVAGLERLQAPSDAIDFYAEHRTADPRHGNDWLHNVVAPLQRNQRWSVGIVRGARWRSAVNHAFLKAISAVFLDREP